MSDQSQATEHVYSILRFSVFSIPNDPVKEKEVGGAKVNVSHFSYGGEGKRLVVQLNIRWHCFQTH